LTAWLTFWPVTILIRCRFDLFSIIFHMVLALRKSPVILIYMNSETNLNRENKMASNLLDTLDAAIAIIAFEIISRYQDMGCTIVETESDFGGDFLALLDAPTEVLISTIITEATTESTRRNLQSKADEHRAAAADWAGRVYGTSTKSVIIGQNMFDKRPMSVNSINENRRRSMVEYHTEEADRYEARANA
jgi:hypothetical protein